VPAGDTKTRIEIAKVLASDFSEAIAARVAAAQLAIEGGDPAAIKTALEVFVDETHGSLAWALRGRWQCGNCGHRPGPFSWRCGQCRRWAELRMETGVEPPPVASRDRRAAPRVLRPEGLLGASPDESLPAPTLDSGLSEDDLARLASANRCSARSADGSPASGVAIAAVPSDPDDGDRRRFPRRRSALLDRRLVLRRQHRYEPAAVRAGLPLALVYPRQ
jgi:hypothetical protein